MFYNIILPLFNHISGINLLRYITFRTGCAILTSFAISFFLYPLFIKYFQYSQPIRLDGPKSHIANKQGTPTMGGIVLIFCTILSSLLWCDVSNQYVLSVIFVTLMYSILGFMDDYLKISKKNTKGVKIKYKMICQMIVALLFSYFVESTRSADTIGHLAVPFLKNFTIHNSAFLLFFTTFVVVGSSNAVNLTDGLDGLVTFPVIMAALSFCVITYVAGHSVFANYLQLHYIPNSGELTIFCGSIVGSCLGFLWYNAHPAMIFMGDTGSLAIGGALGAISVIVKHEIVLAIIGGVFVMEALSVMIQIASYKLTGKRLFRMAPIHHHFEEKGWVETKVVVRFWIVSFMLALIGLATLKIR